MEYSSRIFVPNISAEYFRRNAIKKRGKSGQLTTLAPSMLKTSVLCCFFSILVLNLIA